MFLNIGGAVLGVAIMTLISDSVALNNEWRGGPQARLDGYRAAYYYSIGLSALATIPSVFGMPSGRHFAKVQAKNEGEDRSDSSPTPPSESIDEEEKGQVGLVA